MEDNNYGYIYIYKCVVGAGSDICKIGIKWKNLFEYIF